MAGESRNLSVSISPEALASLQEIWDWNANHYGVSHADKYIKSLTGQTKKLATDYFKGRPVPTATRLSYIIIRRKRKGHGHLVVYELIGNVIQVLNYYHTAQDWQTRLAEDLR